MKKEAGDRKSFKLTLNIHIGDSMRVYCPDCDNKPPEFETHYLYRVYIRRQRNSSTNRYQPVGWYCKKCHNFFVFDKEEREIKQALTMLI